MSNTKTNEANFEGLTEVKSQWVKFGKISDWIRGTLTDVRSVPSQLPGKQDEMVKLYEFIAAGGSFHGITDGKVDSEPTVLEQGSFWTVGGKPGIDNQMRNVKLGQIFGMRFSEEKPSKTKGFNPTKVIKVLIGGLDENYSGETAGDVKVEF
jgi:hypothetical protein